MYITLNMAFRLKVSFNNKEKTVMAVLRRYGVAVCRRNTDIQF